MQQLSEQLRMTAHGQDLSFPFENTQLPECVLAGLRCLYKKCSIVVFLEDKGAV